MGHIIEKIALERGNVISCRIDADNQEDFDSEAFRSSDVAIEFTTPGTAEANVRRCFAAGVPVVCGSTGWNAALPEMERICREGKGTLLWSSNFSIGVNIFMAVNRRLASIMARLPQYRPHIVETHHVHKLDHPSGTAVTLAEQIISEVPGITRWAEPEEGGKPDADVLEVDHIRSGEVPGIHTVVWDSPVDSISITHSAKSREGFAMGAVLAAEWLAGKSGWHTLSEVFNF